MEYFERQTRCLVPADLDQDGTIELVASDDQAELTEYVYNPTTKAYDRTLLGKLTLSDSLSARYQGSIDPWPEGLDDCETICMLTDQGFGAVMAAYALTPLLALRAQGRLACSWSRPSGRRPVTRRYGAFPPRWRVGCR